MTRSSRTNRTGFMTMLTIAMLGLVTAALVGMTMAANMDHHRTESECGQAQLRMLLLAGTEAVRADTNHLSGPATKWAIAVPGVGSAPLLAESKTESDGSVSVHLVASIGTHHLDEQLQLRRDHDQWSIISASLN